MNNSKIKKLLVNQ